MAGSGAMMAGALAGLAGVGLTSAAATGVARRQRTYLPRGHASRVDNRRDPLASALRYGCAGLTIGVRVDPRGRLLLAGAEDRGRTLQALVLDPLAQRVRVRRQVYSAQHEPFVVVLEPATGVDPAHLLDVLDDELAGHAAMVSGYVDGVVTPGPVLVLAAGTPRRIIEGRSARLFFGEGTLGDTERGYGTAVLPVLGEHIAWRLSWDGRGDMPGEERHLLRALVRTAHAEGKRVRFFGEPASGRGARRALWHELHAAGTDLISARDLGALRRFLRRQHAHR